MGLLSKILTPLHDDGLDKLSLKLQADSAVDLLTEASKGSLAPEATIKAMVTFAKAYKINVDEQRQIEYIDSNGGFAKMRFTKDGNINKID